MSIFVSINITKDFSIYNFPLYNMKNILFFAFLFVVTSCITSKYPAGEPKDQIEDDKLIGNWTYQPAPKYKDDPMGKFIKTLAITKNEGQKSYTITMSGQEGKEESLSFKVIIHKIKGENFLSLFAEKENPDSEYIYVKYKLESKKLMLYPIVEEKAIKDKNAFKKDMDKKTQFDNEKALRTLLAKNTKGGNQNINAKEPLIYTK